MGILRAVFAILLLGNFVGAQGDAEILARIKSGLKATEQYLSCIEYSYTLNHQPYMPDIHLGATNAEIYIQWCRGYIYYEIRKLKMPAPPPMDAVMENFESGVITDQFHASIGSRADNIQISAHSGFKDKGETYRPFNISTINGGTPHLSMIVPGGKPTQSSLLQEIELAEANNRLYYKLDPYPHHDGIFILQSFYDDALTSPRQTIHIGINGGKATILDYHDFKKGGERAFHFQNHIGIMDDSFILSSFWRRSFAKHGVLPEGANHQDKVILDELFYFSPLKPLEIENCADYFSLKLLGLNKGIASITYRSLDKSEYKLPVQDGEIGYTPEFRSAFPNLDLH